MKYIALIYMDPNTRTPPNSPEFGKMMSGYQTANETYKNDGVWVAGDALQPSNTATTVRVRGGKTETMDGPFAETKEQLGGFYILDCANLDEAIRYAAMIPHAADGCVEVPADHGLRPLMQDGREMADIAGAIDRIARIDGGRLLSNLVGSLRNFQLAEDSLQDAFESALTHWSRNGLPNSPQAWLMQTAKRKAIDRLRRSANFRQKTAEISYLIEIENDSPGDDDPMHIGDERLKLIFTCCHPALDRKTCVALTLRSVCGLKTEEIADAFLDGHDAMAQRLVRARHKIAKAGIAYEVPAPEGWAERLESVLAVIYLIFNEGYASTGDTHIRSDLCEEAIRLARLLMTLRPHEPEIEGLLALMLLHHARRNARLGADGEIRSLEDQDRAIWDRQKIAEGTQLLEQAMCKARPGPYQLQAAIIAVHAEASSYQQTDWPQIALLYQQLARTGDNPVYELNRIVALSYVEGPQAALLQLRPIALALVNYQPFHAVQADLLARTGQNEAAAIAYQTAIQLSQSEAERLFLSKRMALLSDLY